jgi:hypothetical protein
MSDKSWGADSEMGARKKAMSWRFRRRLLGNYIMMPDILGWSLE